MCIFEFNEERELTLIRHDEREFGREEGYKEGFKIGYEEGRTKALYHCINLMAQYDLKHHVPEQDIIQKISEIYCLEYEKAKRILQELNLIQAPLFSN